MDPTRPAAWHFARDACSLDGRVGQVIAFADGVRMRRDRESRARHACCVEILASSVTSAHAALAVAAERDRPVWARRVRRLEALHAWVAGAV
jgi:hypothetical protein